MRQFINKNAQTSDPEKYAENAKHINAFYEREFASSTIEESKMKFSQAPAAWYDYDFFDKDRFDNLSSSRKQEILKWFKQYGTSYFYDLDIWNIAWLNEVKE